MSRIPKNKKSPFLEIQHLLNILPIGYHELDTDGCITYVNNFEAKLIGLPEQDLIGQNFVGFIVEENRGAYESRLNSIYDNEGESQSFKTKLIDKRDCRKTVLLHETIVWENGEIIGVAVAVQDITEMEQASETFQTRLKIKEILFRGIHHRVKNNMQVVSSLLSLQSGYIEDKKIKAMFRESQDRIRSMALVHEKLYQTPDLAKIDILDYIQELITETYQAYGNEPENIHWDIQVEQIYLDVDIAIPCGLVLNELATNAIRHAFPASFQGQPKISIGLHSNNYDKMIIIVINDNGIGLPSDVDFHRKDSLGFFLMALLVEEQLKGEVKVERNQGTRFEIKFPI